MSDPTGGYVRYVWGMNSKAEYGFSLNQTASALYGVPAITDRMMKELHFAKLQPVVAKTQVSIKCPITVPQRSLQGFGEPPASCKFLKHR